MKRIENSLILLLFGISYIMVFHFSLRPDCLFKKVIGLPCATCGMTRAFDAILKGNIIESFSYNILGFPLFLFLVWIGLLLLHGLIFNKDTFLQTFERIPKKTYLLIIPLLLISWIVNLIK